MRISTIIHHATPLLVGAALLAGLFEVSQYNPLLFHALAEMFSIMIACAIFMLAWNARRFMRNDYLLFVGIAYLFIANIDLLHTLAYRGMGVFEDCGTDVPTQLWIGARGIEALSLLIAPLFLSRQLKPALLWILYAVVTGALVWSVFDPNAMIAFPMCHQEGVGLTAFKKISEYVICTVLLAGLIVLLAKRRFLSTGMLVLMAASVVTTIGAEMAFTFYVGVFDYSNMLGHILKLVSFYLIYRAIITGGLNRPYQNLFRELTASEQALRKAGEHLEQRVRERTGQVRQLALELTRTEHRERWRLTRILHDGVQPLLVGAKMQLGAMRKRVKDPDEKASLARVGDLLVESLEATRSVAMELSPPVPHDGGLVPALDWLAHRMQTQHELTVAVDATTDAEPADENVRILLFEATRELLLNIVKHAAAESASIVLRRVSDTIEIVVADTGSGFSHAETEQSDPSQTGLGLMSIRNRLELLGGRMHIDSAPGKGTQVRIQAPSGGPLSEPPRR